LIRPLSHAMKDCPDRSGTSLGTRGGAGSPEHQRSGAASRPRAPSPRVVSCPTCGASQLCNAELFVNFAFLVSVGVVTCIFVSYISLVAL